MFDPNDDRELASLAWTLVLGLWVSVMAGSVGGQLFRDTGADVAVAEFMEHAGAGDLSPPAPAVVDIGV